MPERVPCALAFVADCPGDTEVCRGKPLCGPEGRIFDRMLRLAGIDRAACFVGHVFDEQPPGDDLKPWLEPGQFETHFERLAGELAEAQPAVIVPLGGTALWAFTGSNAIGAARGAIARATAIAPGAKILPTFAPGYILRQYKMLGTMVADLRKAKAEAARPSETLRLSARELWLDPTLADIDEFLAQYLLGAELIAIDIETSVNQITKIGFAADSEHALTIPFVDYRNPDRCYWPTVEEEMLAWERVQFVCALPQPKLFQNGPFDNWHLIRAGIRVRNWREDTRLLHHALYPELPKSLAYMGSTYCHQGPWKLLAHHGKAKRDD